MESLPNDVLLAQVMPLLPPGSLMRFSAVNRRFLKLVRIVFAWKKLNLCISSAIAFLRFSRFLRGANVRMLQEVNIAVTGAPLYMLDGVIESVVNLSLCFYHGCGRLQLSQFLNQINALFNVGTSRCGSLEPLATVEKCR